VGSTILIAVKGPSYAKSSNADFRSGDESPGEFIWSKERGDGLSPAPLSRARKYLPSGGQA